MTSHHRPAPLVSPGSPPFLGPTALDVLRILHHQSDDAWLTCAQISTHLHTNHDGIRTIVRLMTGCGWTERRYQSAIGRTLLYRLTDTGRHEALTTFGPA